MPPGKLPTSSTMNVASHRFQNTPEPGISSSAKSLKMKFARKLQTDGMSERDALITTRRHAVMHWYGRGRAVSKNDGSANERPPSRPSVSIRRSPF